MSTRIRLTLLGAFLLSGAVLCLAHVSGRMTGGGSIFEGDLRITHGFELHCATDDTGTNIPGPNNLEINWEGNHFHLESMIFAVCTLNGDPKPPSAPFTDYDAAGLGRYNSEPNCRASWRFTDYGEPGTQDLIIRLTIDCPVAGTVLNVTSPVPLTFGNHQAHK